jgi:hypothetical protein
LPSDAEIRYCDKRINNLFRHNALTGAHIDSRKYPAAANMIATAEVSSGE